MKNNDVIVIGGGLAGLTAAAAAGQGGASVLLITKGVGSIGIGGGTIDVLGYDQDGGPVDSAAAGLAVLPPGHPYTLLGSAGVGEGLAFLADLAAGAGYPYIGDLAEPRRVVTAAGTLKPSCLIPRTMDTAPLAAAGDIAVIGFAGLRDYYPDIVLRGLCRHIGGARRYRVEWLENGFGDGRDITALDIARVLDRPAGRRLLIGQLVRRLTPGAVAVLPPVLGTRPNYSLLEELEAATGCAFIETAGLPPAVTGLRLRTLLLARLRELGVRIIEQADVTGAVVEGDTCRAVVTSGPDRDRTYYARAFVLASGGIFGGGIRVSADDAVEPVLGLPVQGAGHRDAWAGERLFARDGQPFARCGVAVDASLRPTDGAGRVLFANVHIAGRTLAGYDYCQEKSGNGVAVVTGYHAGRLVGEGRA